ncbi:hypothetical protein THAOC_04198 [Thalassiosira oceanica]|uniref:Uncharacterized protein n=1 Tax=Thalassiosira oceanica TaxID=159749 RepID=K0TAL0_THAOC|nr:hypothetical protein THAOC_04198 [Thalassiosira oceanica]|eukprot:EJK74139.1 hypothetical protein THAOC_04198 [Thalassiosira oceanica]
MAPLAAPEDIITDFLNKREVNFPEAGGTKGETNVPSVALLSYPMLMSLTNSGKEVRDFTLKDVLGAVAEDSAQLLKDALGTGAEGMRSVEDLINVARNQNETVPHGTTLQVGPRITEKTDTDDGPSDTVIKSDQTTLVR